MKAIQIKYLSPTNTQGCRLKVWAEGGKKLIISRKYCTDFVDQARDAAELYLNEMNWYNTKISGFGCLPNGDYVATLESI